MGRDRSGKIVDREKCSSSCGGVKVAEEAVVVVVVEVVVVAVMVAVAGAEVAGGVYQ